MVTGRLLRMVDGTVSVAGLTIETDAVAPRDWFPGGFPYAPAGW
jgi:hypothetical protein